MTPLEKMKEAVKTHYNMLLGDFLKAIDGIEIEKFPAIHIPVLGSNYGTDKYRNIAIYGMETKEWKNMSKLKSESETGNAYEYLTDDFISMRLFNNFKKVKTKSFFGFIIKFLDRLYDTGLDEKGGMIAFRDEEEGKKVWQSIIWGNIYALEMHNIGLPKKESDKNEPDNWKKVRKASEKIFDAHLLASKEEYAPFEDQLRYILETCQPKVLLLLCREEDFIFGPWLKQNYNSDWEKPVIKYVRGKTIRCDYAHIKTDKIDTHIYKCAHPTYMIKNEVRFLDVINRIKSDLNGRLMRTFYELWIEDHLTRNKNFISRNGRTIKSINKDISIFLDISPKNELLIGFENKNFNAEERLIELLCGQHFNKYFSKIHIDKQSNSIYKKYLEKLKYQTSVLGKSAFLWNCISELENGCKKLV
jgi:hypothetical protein